MSQNFYFSLNSSLDFRNSLTDRWKEIESQKYILKNIQSISYSSISDLSKSREPTDRTILSQKKECNFKNETKKVYLYFIRQMYMYNKLIVLPCIAWD